MTTGPYLCKFHSRDNDDLYLTNLSQILKIHVDFRVISRSQQDSNPVYRKPQNCVVDSKIPLLCSDKLGKQQKQPPRKSAIFILTDNTAPLLLMVNKQLADIEHIDSDVKTELLFHERTRGMVATRQTKA